MRETAAITSSSSSSATSRASAATAPSVAGVGARGPAFLLLLLVNYYFELLFDS